MKLKLQEINVTKIDGSKQKLALDYKGLANYIFNQTKDLGELELARELYKEGELEVDREIAIASKGYVARLVQGGAYFRWIKYEMGQASNTVLASDGILSSYRSDDYFKFKSGDGFETVSGNYGLKVSPNGLYRLKNGEWELL